MASRTIDLRDLSGYFSSLGKFVEGIDLTPVLEQARDRIAADTDNCFANSVSPKGQPWAPIHHRVGKPLVKTGDMQRAAIEQIKNAPVANNCLSIRINHPFYAMFHQNGTSRIQQREWFGLNELTRRRVYADAVAEIAKQLSGAKL